MQSYFFYFTSLKISLNKSRGYGPIFSWSMRWAQQSEKVIIQWSFRPENIIKHVLLYVKNVRSKRQNVGLKGLINK